MQVSSAEHRCACSIQGGAQARKRRRVQPPGARTGAQGSAKAEIVGSEPGERGDVGKAERTGKAADETGCARRLNETGKGHLTEMSTQPTGALVSGIEHHPEQTGARKGAKIREIGPPVGHEHGHEPHPALGEGSKGSEDLGPVSLGKKADLDHVHPGRRDPFRRRSDQLRIHRQIACSGGKRHPTRKARDGGGELRQGPGPKRTALGVFKVQKLDPAFKRGLGFLEIGDTCEQSRTTGKGQGRSAHGRESQARDWLALPKPAKSKAASQEDAMIRLTGGRIYDPLNGIDGEVRDLWIAGDRIVPAPPPGTAAESFDVSGCVVMPGGIDLHSHIGGGKVTIARLLMAEEHRRHRQPRGDGLRAGSGEVSPSSFTTGYRYAELGYTAAFEPAMLPANARAAHQEMADIPIVDRGAYVVLGNDDLFLNLLAEGAGEDAIADYVGWTLQATGALAVKIVNPGGIAAFKYGQRQLDLDEGAGPWGVTPRRVLHALADALDRLGVPHPIHVHGCNLGMPGSAASTLATIRAMEGRRIHLTHLQFHAYGREGPRGFSSGAPAIAELINAASNVSLDVGQVLFGQTVTASADTMAQFRNASLARPRRFVGMDIECEAGCGVLPFRYKDKSFVNALQWAVGLELFLLVEDPWRIALTTDHPNGAAFTRYPELIRLLMDKDFRDAEFAKLPATVRALSILPSIKREYSLFEIAILTRAGPARLLGLAREYGHLGPGAKANIAVYREDRDRARMFASAHLLFKDGRLVVRDGAILAPELRGAFHRVQPGFDRAIEGRVRSFFETYRDQRLESFVLGEDELSELGAVVTHACCGAPPPPAPARTEARP